MPSPTRRRVLASLSGLTVLGGCSSLRFPGSESTPAGTSRRTTTTTTAPTTVAATEPTRSTTTERSTRTYEPPSASAFEFDVTVDRQPSETAPGRIRASLTNRSDSRFALEGGDTPPVGFDVPDTRRVDTTAPLYLFPQPSDSANDYILSESGGPFTLDDAVYDECWKLPERVLRTDAASGAELPPGTAFTSEYFPLGYPDSGCPAGIYESYGEMSASAETPERVGWVRTTMRIEVDPDGTLSVEGSMRIEAYG